VYEGDKVIGLAIPSTHSGMSKFSDKENTGYRRVVAQMRRIVTSQQNRAALVAPRPVAQSQSGESPVQIGPQLLPVEDVITTPMGLPMDPMTRPG